MSVEGKEKNTALQLTPERYSSILPEICDEDTSLDPVNWSKENPLYGHCAVISLVGQSLFGGKLLRASLEKYPKFAHMRSHYINELPEGERIDFSKTQFLDEYPNDFNFEERQRNYVLSYPETVKRFKLLSIRLAKEVTKNPLFGDPIYQKCFNTALNSSCQKMRFGAVITNYLGESVASAENRTINELASFCDPVCVRLNIQSRTESMLGACGHAEEWVMKEARDRGYDLRKCSLYVAGVKMNGMPSIKNEPEHSCLRCAVQMNFAGLKSINVPVVDHWEAITTNRALETAKLYATGIKKV